ncbi:MAG: hypothetical protein GC189_09820 [Alphaproteobacteria bacterium]|nr:hypothetical protein [Alphaproteobacteria bacterium]
MRYIGIMSTAPSSPARKAPARKTAAQKPAAQKTTAKRDRSRYTVIGGVKVKLAPRKNLLPKAERAAIRKAVRDFYADKKAD